VAYLRCSGLADERDRVPQITTSSYPGAAVLTPTFKGTEGAIPLDTHR
jgi:hypothetical protein